MIKCIQTDYQKRAFFTELSINQNVQFNQNKDTTIIINSNIEKQTIIGFGGAFTESAAYVYHNATPKIKQQIQELYFSEKGLRYNLGRLSIHSCDFSLNSYTYINEFDETLNSFSLEREKAYVLPFINDMKNLNPKLTFMAAPWSPPAFMKTNQKLNEGGKLKKEYYALWAKYLVKYLEEMQKLGINIEYLSIQNEPEAIQVWESCIYTPEEAIAFVKVLRPLLNEYGFNNVKIILLDHNRDLIKKWLNAISKNPEVISDIWGLGIHWYVSEDFAKVGLIKTIIPSFHVLFTEGCMEGGIHYQSIRSGERYARNIIHDFRQGCEGFIDWNLVLDGMGGPNHVGNYCSAPLIVKDNQELIINSSYYYIGHFSKYIYPDAKVIDVIESKDNLHILACQNPKGEVVVVICNEQDEDINYQLNYQELKINFMIPSHTIQTWWIDE